MEKKQKELEEAVNTNKAETSKNTTRLDKVEKEVTDIKRSSKRDKEDAMNQVTSKWSRELMERESRKGNVVVYGLPEPPVAIKSGGERQAKDKQITADLFRALKVDVKEEDVKFAARIGKMTDAISSKPRPLKISFRNYAVRENVFTRARNLPCTKYHALSIVPDLTDQQRKEDKELYAEAEKKNAEMTSEDAENFVYRCIGRRGERTIAKLRRTDRTTNSRRENNQTRANNTVEESESETDNEVEIQDENNTNKRKEREEETEDSTGQETPEKTKRRGRKSKKKNT